MAGWLESIHYIPKIPFLFLRPEQQMLITQAGWRFAGSNPSLLCVWVH